MNNCQSALFFARRGPAHSSLERQDTHGYQEPDDNRPQFMQTSCGQHLLAVFLTSDLMQLSNQTKLWIPLPAFKRRIQSILSQILKNADGLVFFADDYEEMREMVNNIEHSTQDQCECDENLFVLWTRYWFEEMANFKCFRSK